METAGDGQKASLLPRRTNFSGSVSVRPSLRRRPTDASASSGCVLTSGFATDAQMADIQVQVVVGLRLMVMTVAVVVAVLAVILIAQLLGGVIARGHLLGGHREPRHRRRGPGADDLREQQSHRVRGVVSQRPVERDV